MSNGVITPTAIPGVGTVVPSGSLVTPSGPVGPVGAQGASTLSTNAGNLAVLGTDNLILVSQSTIVGLGKYVGSDSTNSNAYAITVNTDFRLILGATILFKVAITNTGAPTLNVNGTGALPICNKAAVALAANELRPNTWLTAFYDGTNWDVMTSLARLYGAFTGNLTLECAGFDAIAVNNNTAANFNLTLNHVPYGIPIGIKIYGAGAAVTYTIAITNPAGASQTVFIITSVSNKSTGATSIMSFGSATCGSGGNIFLTGCLGTAGEAWFT
jgi:hypothetical protein